MAVDKNGKLLKIGQKVLFMGIVGQIMESDIEGVAVVLVRPFVDVVKSKDGKILDEDGSVRSLKSFQLTQI